MQGQAAEKFPRILPRFDQRRLLLVELVLDLADQLFENVLEGNQATGAAEFINNDAEVKLPLQKELQQLLQSRGLGRVDNLARRRQKIGPACGFQAHRIHVLDMDNAESLIEVPRF